MSVVPMTGLKGSSTLGKTEVIFPHPSFKGDTAQFTTEVLGNADHIHVAAHFQVIGRMLARRTNWIAAR